MSEIAASPAVGARRAPRWLWVALVASVAINFLLIGLVAGAAWFRHRAGGPFAMTGNPMGFIGTLPKERREAIRPANHEPLASMRPLWQAVRQARREADQMLTTEPFSAAAFLAAHRRVIDADAEARRAWSQLFADTAARMTPDERAQMLRWRDRQRWWRREHGPRGVNQDQRGGSPPALEPATRP